jgi:hypothetical protein
VDLDTTTLEKKERLTIKRISKGGKIHFELGNFGNFLSF